jgi:hypothetical protein
MTESPFVSNAEGQQKPRRDEPVGGESLKGAANPVIRWSDYYNLD